MTDPGNGNGGGELSDAEISAAVRKGNRARGKQPDIAVTNDVRVVPVPPTGPEVQTAIGPVPILPVLLIGLGGYVMWFAVHYWRDHKQVWPSDPVKHILQGKGLPQPQTAASAQVQVSTYEYQASAAPPAPGPGGPPPSGGPRNIARLLLGRYGWKEGQLGPLTSLWNQESGWDPKARNQSSGAFGIAQALGHGVSCSAAPDGTNEYGPQFGLTCQQAVAANSGSAVQQIRWGLGYIKEDPRPDLGYRPYGSPAAAWAHEQAAGWY